MLPGKKNIIKKIKYRFNLNNFIVLPFIILLFFFICIYTTANSTAPDFKINYFFHLLQDDHIIANVGETVTLEVKTDDPSFSLEWNIIEAPSGSKASIDNKGKKPSIKIDKNGYYYLKLTVRREGAVVSNEYAYIGTPSVVHCVRSNAPGKNNGQNWDNAFTALPKSLNRGHTYYIAGGKYEKYSFNTPEKGNIPVFILKATNDDHGVKHGWKSEYSKNQAVFYDTIIFVTSYYVLDGQTGGGPKEWTSGYGFKVQGRKDYKLINLFGKDWYRPPLPHHITLRHIEISHRALDNDLIDDGIYSKTDVDKEYGAKYITISHCYLHDFGRMALCVHKARYWLFEYNYIARNSYSQKQHSEGWQDFGSDDIVIRYNIWEDIEGTAFIALKKNFNHSNNNWEIYGNVFYCTKDNKYKRGIIGGNGAIGMTDETKAPCTNIRIYNNAFINIRGFNTGIYFPVGNGNKIYNNIWYKCTANTISLDGDHDYNWFYNIRRYDNPVMIDKRLTASEDHGQWGKEDPFVNWIKMNFQLKSPTDPGKVLDFPYNYDIDGNDRNKKGSWNRGPFY